MSPLLVWSLHTEQPLSFQSWLSLCWCSPERQMIKQLCSWRTFFLTILDSHCLFEAKLPRKQTVFCTLWGSLVVPKCPKFPWSILLPHSHLPSYHFVIAHVCICLVLIVIYNSLSPPTYLSCWDMVSLSSPGCHYVNLTSLPAFKHPPSASVSPSLGITSMGRHSLSI